MEVSLGLKCLRRTGGMISDTKVAYSPSPRRGVGFRYFDFSPLSKNNDFLLVVKHVMSTSIDNRSDDLFSFRVRTITTRLKRISSSSMPNLDRICETC